MPTDSRAAKLARIAGWPYWHHFEDEPEYPAVGPTSPPLDPRCDFSALDPEHCLDHAIALADMRWPRWTWGLQRSDDDLYCFTTCGDEQDDEIVVGEGTTPCEAICAAIEARND